MEDYDGVSPLPTTDKEAKKYLPDYPSAYGLYRVRRLQGDTVVKALQFVLETVVSVHEEAGE